MRLPIVFGSTSASLGMFEKIFRNNYAPVHNASKSLIHTPIYFPAFDGKYEANDFDSVPQELVDAALVNYANLRHVFIRL